MAEKTKIVTGRELYQMAMEAAKKWNHGTVPEIGVRESFIFNLLTSDKVISVTVKDKDSQYG